MSQSLRSFGSDYLNYTAPPFPNTDEELEPWRNLLAQWDNPGFFELSENAVNSTSYDFGINEATTLLDQTRPVVAPSMTTPSSTFDYPFQQASVYEPFTLQFADPSTYSPFSYPIAGNSHSIPLPQRLPKLHATLLPPPPAVDSSNTNENKDEDKIHVWSESFYENGKKRRRCMLCNRSVNDDCGTRKRHENTRRHRDRLPAKQRATIPILKCTKCAFIFRSGRLSSVKRHEDSCKGN